MGKPVKQRAIDKQLLIELCCVIAAGVLEHSDDCPEIIRDKFRVKSQKNRDYERPAYYKLLDHEWYMKFPVLHGVLPTTTQGHEHLDTFDLILPYHLLGKTMNAVIGGRFNYGEFAAKQLGNLDMVWEVFANTPFSLSNPGDFEKLAEVCGETFMIHHLFNTYLPLLDMLSQEDNA